MKPFYAILGNGLTSLLAGPTGAIDWLPVPRFDGPTIFGRLLDKHAGGYLSLEPDTFLEVRQRYLPDGLALETEFDTENGTARVTTWMSIGKVVVWMRCESDIPLRLTCRPAFGYGAIRPAYYPTASGMRYQNWQGPELAQLLIQGSYDHTDRIDQWIIRPGKTSIVLRVSTDQPADLRWLTRPIPQDPSREWELTQGYWEAAHQDYQGPHQDLYQRSLEIIRALTYRPTGAPIAAATTSLPEVPGEARQWDYRYVWVRDSAYAAEALLMAGDVASARRIAEFLLNAVSPTEKVFPAPFLRVDGGVPDGEQDLLWLTGHDESRPARAGNGAIHQLQLDLAGSLLWLVYHLQRTQPDAGWLKQYAWAIDALAEWMRRTWSHQDASLWEYRTIKGHHTHSRLMNWAGLIAASSLADQMGREDWRIRWARAARRIADQVQDDVRITGLYAPRIGHTATDAALLTLPLYHFIDVHDTGFLTTLDAIEKNLVVDGLVYRYREDDFGATRYPFVLAGFWYARVLLRLGRIEEADHVVQQHVNLSTPLGLFGEHADPETGNVRGNFPQLFSHTGLIMTLAERQQVIEHKPLWPFPSLDTPRAGSPLLSPIPSRTLP